MSRIYQFHCWPFRRSCHKSVWWRAFNLSTSVAITLHFFCLSCLEVKKSYFTFSNQLRAGRNVYLRQLIMASLYEASRLASSAMKTFSPTNNPKGTLLLVGPLWLLQLWLNSTFEPYLVANKPTHPTGESKDLSIEGN